MLQSPASHLLLLQAPQKHIHFLGRLNVTLGFGDTDAVFVGGDGGRGVAGLRCRFAQGLPGGGIIGVTLDRGLKLPGGLVRRTRLEVLVTQ